MVPTGTEYSVFYLFTEHFGLRYSMRVENDCSAINDTHFTGSCKHLVGNYLIQCTYSKYRLSSTSGNREMEQLYTTSQVSKYNKENEILSH